MKLILILAGGMYVIYLLTYLLSHYKPLDRIRI